MRSHIICFLAVTLPCPFVLITTSEEIIHVEHICKVALHSKERVVHRSTRTWVTVLERKVYTELLYSQNQWSLNEKHAILSFLMITSSHKTNKTILLEKLFLCLLHTVTFSQKTSSLEEKATKITKLWLWKSHICILQGPFRWDEATGS